MQSINEKWIQFAYLNAKSNVSKTPLKLPFSQELEVDAELTLSISGANYTFNVVGKETKSNHDGKVDVIYAIASPQS